MPELPVVADSGPLIALALIGHLDLLRDIYGAVLVPDAVWREVTEAAPERPGAIEMVRSPWLVRTVLSHPPDPLLRAELGLGEAEAIALATELGGRLLLDERKARRIAEIGYVLPVRGTIGTLLLAKKRTLIPALRPLLLQVRSAGYFLSTAIIEAACESAGE